jgi:3-isopropylmalate/(R)-2-methylmalate dehydratase small subunit
MSLLKVSTLTSRVLAIAKDVKKCDQEMLDINIEKANPSRKENILVVDVDCNKVSNYDQIVKSIFDMGFGVVISDVFTDMFKVKAVNYGILTVEVSNNFLNKIIESSKKSAIKLFVDFEGLEVMIINSGEKEYFELNDYYKESYENGQDDIESLYSVWDNMHNSYKEEEILECAIE